MKYAIVTPTYINHFKFITPYLKSFVKYVSDKDKIILYFIISKSENEIFQKIISAFQNSCNITVLYIEDILRHFGIQKSSEDILKRYGRFSFQTLKKMYTLLYIPEEKSLILDSESMWISQVKMSDMFNKFFSTPKIFGSTLETEFRKCIDFNQMVENVNLLLEFNCPFWFLENYMWFYEKKIVKDLVKQYGKPIEMAEKVRTSNQNKKLNENISSGIFEIILYQNFIYKNLQRYHYVFVNIDTEIKKYLSIDDYKKLKKTFYQKLKGSCGLTEHTCLFLNKKNIKPLSKMFNDLYIKILRCDKTNKKLYFLQKQFLNNIKPYILASSQNHCWGINNNIKSRFDTLILFSENYKKLKKHIRNLLQPLFWIYIQVKNVLDWFIEIFSVLFYLIRVLFDFIKNFKIILLE